MQRHERELNVIDYSNNLAMCVCVRHLYDLLNQNLRQHWSKFIEVHTGGHISTHYKLTSQIGYNYTIARSVTAATPWPK